MPIPDWPRNVERPTIPLAPGDFSRVSGAALLGWIVGMVIACLWM